MYQLLQLSLFKLLLLFASAYSHNEEEMIVDLIKSIEKPFFVNSLLCWTPKKTRDFVSLLNDNGYQHLAGIDHYFNNSMFTHQLMILADIRCPDYENVYNKAEKLNLFKRPHRWIILGGYYNDVVVPTALFNLQILLDCEALVAYSAGNQSFLLYSIFRAQPQSLWRFEVYGNWSPTNGVVKAQEMSTTPAIRRTGFSELNLRVTFVILNNDTFKHLWDYKNTHIDTITKVDFRLTNYLIDFMKCNKTFIYTNSWGYFINGSWSGEMGHLTRGGTDLGGSAMFFLKERTYFIDYLLCPTYTRSKFLFRQPPLSYENNLYLLAFGNSVWFSTLGLIFILLFSLLASAYWELVTRKNKPFDGTTTLKASISDITIFILGAVCQQGSPVELKSSLGRVVMFALFITSTFLYTSYSANIVALRQYSTSNIRTLKDLLYSKLELGVEDIIYNRYYFPAATEPIRKAIYQKKVAPPGKKPRYLSVEEGIKKIKEEPFAFNVETGVGYKFVEKYFYESEKCDLREISYLTELDPWITCPKNSPYREIFLVGLSRLREHGINDRENQMFYTKKPKCTSRSGNFVSVSIVDCYPALLVLAYGAMVSVALLILEIIIHKSKGYYVKETGTFVSNHQVGNFMQ